MLIRNDKNKLSKIFTQKLKKNLVKILLIFNILFVLTTVVLFFNSIRFRDNVDFRINQISNLFIPKGYEWSIDKMKNVFQYTFYNVKTTKLLINANFKNTNQFYNQLKISNEKDNNKKHSKGSLISSSNSYKIKFRPKGDRNIHYKTSKPSFSVEILDGKSFLGMNKFSLQSPEVRNYLHELLWIELLKKNDIISPLYFYTDLTFNGQSLGIYNYEEKPSTFMLERLGHKNSSILKFNEANGFFLKYNPEIKVINQEDVSIKNQNISTSILRRFIEGKSKVSETFDIEKLAIFFAISDLTKTYHGLLEKSMRFYYNPFTNLLEPIPFDGHATNEPLTLLHETDPLSPWLKLFFNKKNKDFTNLYFEKLKYFASEEYLAKINGDKSLKNIMDEAKKIIYKNSKNPIFPYYFDYLDYLLQNSISINEKLNKKTNIQFYSSFDNSSFQIHAKNFDNIIPLEIKSFESKNYKFNYKKNILLYKGYNQNIFEDLQTNDSFFNDILINKKFKINYFNLKQTNIVSNINLFEYKSNLGGYSNNYLKKLLELNIISKKMDTFFLNNNNVILDDILIIPNNKTLVLNPDQKIYFKNDSGIILNGDSFFNGKPLKPINFFGDKDNGAGFILAIGSSQVTMKNVNFINLSSFGSFDISGSVSFYNSKVELIDVNFYNNFSEDYLNLINTKFSLKNVLFENCNSDCFDADFSKGKLLNVKFNVSGNDGLDVSESGININNIYFNKIGDKAISAGENSKIILNNIVIKNSEIGLVSKDGSIIQGDDVNIDSVRLPIAIFKKKPRYSNPSISLNNYFSHNSEIKYLIEKPLNIRLNKIKINGNKILVENLLYGNNFGIKTKK
jgi:hypothetical protein